MAAAADRPDDRGTRGAAGALRGRKLAMLSCALYCAAAVVLSSCAGPASTTSAKGQRGGFTASDHAASARGASELVAPAAAVTDTIRCISSDVHGVELLGWLAVQGEFQNEPFRKLFSEPPITGPRPGVDTTLYVELWRSICADSANRVVDIPDSVASQFAPFNAWPDSAKDAFVLRTWRGALFGTAPSDSLPPPPPAPRLGLMAQAVTVTHPASTGAIVVVNEGGGTLNWTATDPCSWLTETPTAGGVLHSEGDTVTLTVNWTSFSSGETKTCTVSVATNGGAATVVLTATKASTPPPPTGVLPASAFHPKGAFRSPRGSGNANLAWGGGAALAFRPAGDAGRGSLFSSGHAYGGLAVEFTIPTPSTSTNLNSLPIAAKLQEWGDLTGGHYATFTDGELKRTGDYCVLPDDRVVVSLYDAYGADSRDLATILLSRSSIASPSTLGPWHVGQTQSQASNPDHYFRTCEGMCVIPPGPAARLGCDLMFMGGGRLGAGTYGSPLGPSARGVKASDLSGTPRDIPRKVLLDWPVGHPVKGMSVCSNPVYPSGPSLCSADTFTDCAWIEVGGRGVVVFLSNNCDGPGGEPSPAPSTSHYYDPSGAGGPNDPGICPGANKGQVCDGSSSAELWAFDPADLERVARGEIQPWDPEPVWVIDLDGWLIVPKCRPGMCGMAWDPVGRRLIFGQAGADDSAGAGPYDPLALWYVLEVGP